MAVVNVPANTGVHLNAGQVPGLMYVYCVGPAMATFGISIVNPPPPYVWHQLAAGHMLTFQVDGFDCWVENNGPSTIQLLYNTTFEGKEVREVEGATPFYLGRR
ncbi:MAG: hypothetical protein JNN15_12590 [Blastocatellia bacterium]|nr:hypothetical protein [Blastocatellia bacterium]